MKRRKRALFLGAVTLALGCHAHAPDGHAVRPAVSGAEPSERAGETAAGDVPVDERALLDDLALLATGDLPEGATLEREKSVLQHSLALAGYVDALLEDPRFGERVAPKMILKQDSLYEVDAPVRGMPLQSKGSVLYLRQPCDARTAQRVHPWWAMESEVLVCPDSYQPDHLRTKNGWSYCGGTDLSGYNNPKGSLFCGCGPNLLNCNPDGDYAERQAASIRSEVMKTIGYVVAQDLPLERAFTMNETVRDGIADTIYQRWQVMSGEASGFVPAMPVTQPAHLAPRRESTPGEHAGILTSQLAFVPDSPRARLRDYYNVLWCKQPDSVGVTADKIFGLGVTNLREGDGWRKLAAMPICTNCHARLDYGMQFFKGFLSHNRGPLFEPREHVSGTGPFYGRDIDDELGEGPLTPRGFAEIAVKQPAFARCVVKDVNAYVFGGAAAAEDESALRAAFDKSHGLKDLMRVALLLYESAHRRSGRPKPVATVTLRAHLEARCGACHSTGSRDFLGQTNWPRELTLEMVSKVGFGSMPPDHPLESGERRMLVSSLLDTVFSDPESRAAAMSYFSMETLPVRDASVVQALLHARAGADAPTRESVRRWPIVEEDELKIPRYSPAFAAAVAREALASCKQVKLRAAELQQCVEHAVTSEGIVSGLAAGGHLATEH